MKFSFLTVSALVATGCDAFAFQKNVRSPPNPSVTQVNMKEPHKALWGSAAAAIVGLTFAGQVAVASIPDDAVKIQNVPTIVTSIGFGGSSYETLDFSMPSYDDATSKSAPKTPPSFNPFADFEPQIVKPQEITSGPSEAEIEAKKTAEKAAAEAKRAEEKAAAEARKAEEKAAAEAKKAEERAAAEAAKEAEEARKAEEKAAAEAKKAEEKAAAEAARQEEEARKAEEKAAKEARRQEELEKQRLAVEARKKAEDAAKEREAATPSTSIPEFKAPEFKSPDVAIPEFKAPEMPKFSMPKVDVPKVDFEAPKIEAPKVEIPKFGTFGGTSEGTPKAPKEYAPQEVRDEAARKARQAYLDADAKAKEIEEKAKEVRAIAKEKLKAAKEAKDLACETRPGGKVICLRNPYSAGF